MEEIAKSIVDFVLQRADIGHIALIAFCAVSVWALKSMRQDLRECANNYVTDNKAVTAALVEFSLLLGQIRDKL